MKRFATDLMAVGLIVGLLTVGLLSGPARASANGPAGISSCAVGGARIVCVGTINGNDIRIDISTNPVFQPTFLMPLLDSILANAANISDIPTQVNTIATSIAQTLMRFNIHSCQVTVTELGWTGFATYS